MEKEDDVTYWLINLWFLGAVAIVAAAAWVFRRRPLPVAMLGAFVVVGVLTAIFDNAIIGFGIVDYDAEKISGVRIGFAPIEDFAYTLAGAVLIPVLWAVLGRRTSRRTS